LDSLFSFSSFVFHAHLWFVLLTHTYTHTLLLIHTKAYAATEREGMSGEERDGCSLGW